MFFSVYRFEAVSLLSEQVVFEDLLPPRVSMMLTFRSLLLGTVKYIVIVVNNKEGKF